MKDIIIIKLLKYIVILTLLSCLSANAFFEKVDHFGCEALKKWQNLGNVKGAMIPGGVIGLLVSGLLFRKELTQYVFDKNITTPFEILSFFCVTGYIATFFIREGICKYGPFVIGYNEYEKLCKDNSKTLTLFGENIKNKLFRTINNKIKSELLESEEILRRKQQTNNIHQDTIDNTIFNATIYFSNNLATRNQYRNLWAAYANDIIQLNRTKRTQGVRDKTKIPYHLYKKTYEFMEDTIQKNSELEKHYNLIYLNSLSKAFATYYSLSKSHTFDMDNAVKQSVAAGVEYFSKYIEEQPIYKEQDYIVDERDSRRNLIPEIYKKTINKAIVFFNTLNYDRLNKTYFLQETDFKEYAYDHDDIFEENVKELKRSFLKLLAKGFATDKGGNLEIHQEITKHTEALNIILTLSSQT